MASKPVSQSIGGERGASTAFRGLSDKDAPELLALGESPDLLNVDFSEGSATRRNGYVRIWQKPLRNGSIRLDGINDHLRVTNKAAYQPGGSNFYLAGGVVLRSRPAAAVSVLSWGFGAVGSLFVDIRYDPAGGSGGLGAWIARLRDSSGAGTTRTLTVDDGDGSLSPVGQYRFLEVICAAADIGLKVWDEFGNVSSATSAGPVTTFNWSSGQDLFFGVGTTATNTVGTDYADVTLCEWRYAVPNTGPVAYGITATTSNLYYISELPTAAAALCVGYWKMNDGSDAGICVDTVSANNATIVNNPATWINPTAQPLVLGQSALKFTGGNGWMDLQDIGALVTDTFVTLALGGTVQPRWTFRLIYIPALPPGITTMPDGVIFWAGNSAAAPPVPQPIGLRVVSDRFEARYNDGGAVVTCTLNAGGDPTVTSLVGKRLRIALKRTGTGNGSFTLELAVDNGNGAAITYKFKTNACANAAAGAVSTDWSFGRRVTNFAQARLGSTAVFGTDGACIGTIDDVQLIHTYNIGVGVGVGNVTYFGVTYNPFTEVTNWNGNLVGGVVHSLVLYLKLNDGAGDSPATIGTLTTDPGGGWRCYLRPSLDDGARWDVGLVDTQTPMRGALLRSYDRFVNDRKTRREVLIASGTTLYAYDETQSVLRIVGPLPARADMWTFAQYGQRALLAGAPGRRPVWTDGNGVHFLGIRAPTAAAIPTVAAGGAMVAGTYFLYVTYRNRDTGVESNPSPGVSVTFAAGNLRINPLSLPLSSDPQVNQRRVYMTAVGGVDGSPMYLVATIDDNSTASYTVNIDGPVSTSATAITDYYQHAEAPSGSVIAQFKDYTVAAGDQLYPTRLWYSQAGSPDYWNTRFGGSYLDLDLDTGRAITGCYPMIDKLLVDFSDGRAVVATTGDSAVPLTFQFANRSHGSVGPQAGVVSDDQFFYIAEKGIFSTTGFSETRLSGPEFRPINVPRMLQDVELPSIDRLLLRKIIGANRRFFNVVEHRARKQFFFNVSVSDMPRTDGCNLTLVYDQQRKIWSKYDHAIDCADRVDDVNGDEKIWAIVAGYLVELDKDACATDGEYGFVPAGVVSSVSGQDINVTGFGLGSTNSLRFRTCYLYRYSDNTVLQFLVRANTNTVLTAADGVSLSGVAANDVLIVGGVPMFIDFVFRLGALAHLKRLHSVRLVVSGDYSPTYLRFAYKTDVIGYDPAYTGWTDVTETWDSNQIAHLFHVGGQCRMVRVRLSDTGIPNATSSAPVPAVARLRLSSIECIGEEVAAP